MPRYARRLLPAVLVLVLAPAAVARADAYQQVRDAYASRGFIPPCLFSAATLQAAEASIPNDVDQYAPNFRQAIDAALQQRASGACVPKQAAPKPSPSQIAPPNPSGPAPGTPSTSAPAAPSSHTVTVHGTRFRVGPARHVVISTPAPAAEVVAARRAATALGPVDDGGPPAALLALGGLAALLALGVALAGVVRMLGLEGRWSASARHAWREAALRLGAAGADLADRLRFGR